MLTDEIMDQIEKNTGVSEEAAVRYTSTQTAYDTKTLKQHNIQENDTMDLSSELKGGTGTTTTDPTEQTAMDTEEGEERQPTKRRASEAGVDIPKSAVDSTVEQLEHDMEKLARQKSREHRGNTPWRCTLRESRSKDRRTHEHTRGYADKN